MKGSGSGQQLGGEPIWVQENALSGAFFKSGAYLNTPASEALRALNIREDIFVNGTDEERLAVGRRFEEVDFDPAPFAEALLEWVLLWQIDIGEDFDLDGDHGWFTIYVFIQRHRLKARDFANCMVILQNTRALRFWACDSQFPAHGLVSTWKRRTLSSQHDVLEFVQRRFGFGGSGGAAQCLWRGHSAHPGSAERRRRI
ncbi:MAG: hypothetical protein R3B07_19340 [Polyangiaceae bacterium]